MRVVTFIVMIIAAGETMAQSPGEGREVPGYDCTFLSQPGSPDSARTAAELRHQSALMGNIGTLSFLSGTAIGVVGLYNFSQDGPEMPVALQITGLVLTYGGLGLMIAGGAKKRKARALERDARQRDRRQSAPGITLGAAPHGLGVNVRF